MPAVKRAIRYRPPGHPPCPCYTQPVEKGLPDGYHPARLFKALSIIGRAVSLAPALLFFAVSRCHPTAYASSDFSPYP